MEFDKSRVYTALNADDLPIGSKCIFANNVFTLKDHVRNNYPAEILISVCSETITERFNSDSDEFYSLAYLIEPSAKSKYKPFESVEKAMETIKKHGGWVRDEGTGCTFLVLGYGKHKEDFSIYINSEWVPLEDLFIDFVFADDGSPCGELVEE